MPVGGEKASVVADGLLGVMYDAGREYLAALSETEIEAFLRYNDGGNDWLQEVAEDELEYRREGAATRSDTTISGDDSAGEPDHNLRVCEHKWRNYEGIGVVCRDCGTQAPVEVARNVLGADFPLIEETSDPIELPTVSEWLGAGAPMREVGGESIVVPPDAEVAFPDGTVIEIASKAGASVWEIHASENDALLERVEAASERAALQAYAAGLKSAATIIQVDGQLFARLPRYTVYARAVP